MTTITSGMLAEFVGEIVAPDPKWLKRARLHLDNLTKPLGSLAGSKTLPRDSLPSGTATLMSQ